MKSATSPGLQPAGERQFTPHEEAAIQAALPYYIAANRHISLGCGSPGQYQGMTADEVLSAHGIRHDLSFTGRYWRYGEIVAEMQRRSGIVRGKKRTHQAPSISRSAGGGP